ncbi:MAG: type II secretion system protein N [Pseudomonadota bacterium]|nr:type II secretion system protein N [Pseudomonadota bacterium]
MRGLSANRWAESTHAEAAWGRSRAGTARWGWSGALMGALIAAVCFAPASWLASAVSAGTQQRFMLADARGTVWSGSAMAVLTGGPDSHDASALPGRLNWMMRPRGLALALRLTQDCCLNGTVEVVIKPDVGGFSAALMPTADWIGQWPSDWLTGLGTPWNTLRLGGLARLRSSGLALESAPGRWRVAGGMNVELMHASSQLSTLDTLGSYLLTLQGEPLGAAGAARPPLSDHSPQITLSTLEGALQLSGTGSWGTDGLRFRGEALAREADAAALNNLLNIIGRRDGARSVISIG